MILAIIPARGGSKRIPRKNIKNFLGRPIFSYSIKAAIDSKIFDEVMVSTDDREISETAKKYGAKVPFLRSAKNSDDVATTADVIEEVLLEYQKQGKKYDYVCCLYATAPFATTVKLIEARKIIEQTDADSVFPVVQFSSPIQRSFKINTSGNLRLNWPKNLNVRSQNLIPSYHDAGQFYFLKVSSFLKSKKIFATKARPIIISEIEVQDIDNESDWTVAELKYKMLFRKKHEE